MKKFTGTETQEITIPISEAHSKQDPRRLSEDDLKRMKFIYLLWKAIWDALGKRVELPLLIDGVLRVPVRPDESLVQYSLGKVYADLCVTVAELRQNASRDDPLPHAQAIKKHRLVGLLKAALAAYMNRGLQATLHTEDGAYPLPIMEASDFTEPEPGDDNMDTGTFRIHGLRRDNENGHRLLLGSNDLQVLLPKGDPRFLWNELRDVLDNESHLVGKLVRKSKGDPWIPDRQCKLVKQAVVEEPVTAEEEDA